MVNVGWIESCAAKSGALIRISMSKVRDVINAHLFPVLGIVTTASIASIAISLLPVARHSDRWNVCYEDAIAWYNTAKPGWTFQDKEVFASNFCNGGIPVKGGPGFNLAL